ncbi:hypothetical protein J1614_004012 [Plenodomus biglobosus]|nr:hypothetical protein J1614_004012 [Plenodomus biglobosus]
MVVIRPQLHHDTDDKHTILLTPHYPSSTISQATMPCHHFVASCASPRVMFTTSFRPITHSHTIGTQLKTWDTVCGDCHAAQFRGRRNAALPRVQPHNKSSRRWLAMRDIMLVQALLAVDIPLCWTLELSLMPDPLAFAIAPTYHSIFSKPPSIGRDYEIGSAELQINGERRDRAADPLSSFKLKQTSHPLPLPLCPSKRFVASAASASAMGTELVFAKRGGDEGPEQRREIRREYGLPLLLAFFQPSPARRFESDAGQQSSATDDRGPPSQMPPQTPAHVSPC